MHKLVQQGYPVDAPTRCLVAAGMGSVDALQQFQDEQPSIYTQMLQLMLTVAGAFGKLATAQYLRQHGAEWPLVLLCLGIAWSQEVLA
jgi:hypothetical protein